MERVSMNERPRRREYSGEFKAAVLQETRQSGASVAGVALMHSLNPNMVHRWLRSPDHAFVPLQLTPPAECAPPSRLPTDLPLDDGEVIRIELHRAGASLSVSWPLSAAAQCVQMLRDVLR